MRRKVTWKMTCRRCGHALVTRRRSVACPECGCECRPDEPTGKPPKPFKLAAGGNRIAVSVDAVTLYRDHRCTPTFRRRLGNMEITVHATKARGVLIAYSARLTYAHRRSRGSQWDFSENIPSSELRHAITLLQSALRFVEEEKVKRHST